MEMDGERHGVGELKGEDANGTVASGGEVIGSRSVTKREECENNCSEYVSNRVRSGIYNGNRVQI